MATISSGTWLNLDEANTRGSWDARAAAGINDNGPGQGRDAPHLQGRTAWMQPSSGIATPFLAAQLAITGSMMHLALVPMLALSAGVAMWRLGGGLTLTHARAGLVFSGLLQQRLD